MKKLILVCLVSLFSLSVFSKGVWEITWDFYRIRYQALLFVDDGNTGFIRVKCWNMYNGALIDVVDQNVTTKKVYDGVIINCYNPKPMYGNIPYSADNFKIFNNGAMYMQDNRGNWSTMIVMYQIPVNQWGVMFKKYGLD
jgi:hypothetical protein